MSEEALAKNRSRYGTDAEELELDAEYVYLMAVEDVTNIGSGEPLFKMCYTKMVGSTPRGELERVAEKVCA